MRNASLALSALAMAFAVAALPLLPRTAAANTGVIRCELPDGTRVYTSEGCGEFGALSAPLDARLANRIASERLAEVRLQALRDGRDPAQAVAELDARSLTPRAPGQRRAAAAGCARTPRQLAIDLQASVALGDVNRVAESFDWAGMRSRQAYRAMDRLASLASREIARAEYFETGPAITLDGPALASADADSGILQVAFRGADGVVIDDFDVRRDRGCYFLRLGRAVRANVLPDRAG